MRDNAVLIVVHDPFERSRMGAWLEEEGFDVLSCPGPRGPDYTCLGGRGHWCPLADVADVVVIDLRLASDEMMAGTPGWELLFYYMASGKKIIALSGEEDPIRPGADTDVTVLHRPPTREALTSAVRDQTRCIAAERSAV